MNLIASDKSATRPLVFCFEMILRLHKIPLSNKRSEMYVVSLYWFCSVLNPLKNKCNKTFFFYFLFLRSADLPLSNSIHTVYYCILVADLTLNI